MISIRPLRHSNVIRIDSDGTWTAADLNPAILELRRLIESHGSVSVLECVSKPGRSYVALVWDTIASSFDRVAQIARVAVIGDEARLDVFSRLFRDDAETEARCFPPTQYDAAVAWLQQSSPDVSTSVNRRPGLLAGLCGELPRIHSVSSVQ